ncbi:hypothetical protein [Streptomyces sp. NPDC086787]|uniref:hypothetical protein n=1 Tax=Streptomyces sp. NPDC086787 TaxID=3365759 RepID=UPI0038073DBE
MSIWHQRLAEADISAREPRRPFDVAAGLRRLAQEAGYLAPTAAEPRGSHARHQLDLIAHLVVTQAGAADHVEELAALIGDDGSGEFAPSDFEGWTDAVDIHGVHVFACMLFLANHPESALFWWQFAAGAAHPGAAYCLHLHHLSMGEMREAAFWKDQMSSLRDVPEEFDGSSEEFTEELIGGLESFACYRVRNCAARPAPAHGLEERFERLAHRQDDGGLVCRPDRELPDQIQELAAQR